MEIHVAPVPKDILKLYHYRIYHLNFYSLKEFSDNKEMHLYLKCNLYLSLKYSATVVLILRPASFSTSNWSLSAESPDTPHTVYFLLIEAA